MKPILLTALLGMLLAGQANADVIATRSWNTSAGDRLATMDLTDQPAAAGTCEGPRSAKVATVVSDGIPAATGCWFSIEGNRVAVLLTIERSGETWSSIFQHRQFKAGPAFTGWSVARWE